MYRTFYGLRDKPFTLLPDPDFLYLGKNHATALAMLQYAIMSRAGITLVTGEIGCGKTTMVRQLLKDLGDDAAVGLISNTHHSFGDLQQWVAQAFGLEYRGKGKAELHQVFTDFLVEQYAGGRHTVLIVDEAQNMDVQMLEELRVLSNINADKHHVLQLIVVGQPELRATLRRPELVQFVQRIGVEYHINPLEYQDVVDYVRHRLQVAGGDPALFDEAAIDAVHAYSGGVPRLINLLCDLALVYGYAGQAPRIGVEIVEEVARDKAKGGILPLFHAVRRIEAQDRNTGL